MKGLKGRGGGDRDRQPKEERSPEVEGRDR